MRTIRVMRANGIPGAPSRLIEIAMTDKYYDSFISDLFLVFAAPSIVRAAWLSKQSQELERTVWQRLSLKANTT